MIVEIFNDKQGKKELFFNFNYEQKEESFDKFFLNTFDKFKKQLKVLDIDTDKILLIKIDNITITGSFQRSFSSFWYKLNIEHIKTKDKESINYEKDNIYFCPEEVISAANLKELLSKIKYLQEKGKKMEIEEDLKNKEILHALRKSINEISNASMTNVNQFLRGEGYSSSDINNLMSNDSPKHINNTIEVLRSLLSEISDAAMMNPREFLAGEGYDEAEIDDILEGV